MLSNKIIKEARVSMSDLLQKQEDLNYELLPYFESDDKMDMIRHPLIYSVPHMDSLNALVNFQFTQRKEAAAKALKEKNYINYIYLHEKAYRLQAFEDVLENLNNKEYWSFLGELWTGSENIWQNQIKWKELLLSERSGRNNLMSPEDLKIYKALPDVVLAHRGHQIKNKDGLSYSLDKDKAKWFANRFKRPGEKTEVTSGKIPKGRILAYFSSRNESEIIVI